MLNEKSVGAVVFRMSSYEPLFLLLHYGAGHWDFPKGHMEKGETENETLLRELREETALTDVSLIPGFRRHSRYFFTRDGKTVFKEVSLYLLEAKGGGVKISFEHKAFKWLPFAKALRLTTFKNSKEILRKANEFLKAQGSAPLAKQEKD